MYPFLNEEMVGGGLDFGAVVAFLAFAMLIVFQGYALVRPMWKFLGFATSGAVSGSAAQVDPQHQGIAIVGQPNPEADKQGVVAILPTHGAQDGPGAILPTVEVKSTPTVIPQPGEAQNVDRLPLVEAETGRSYAKQLVVARFSNYWPPYGGINCFNDCEHFADGARVDQAILEGWHVVACPAEWLLGTRIEYPPKSGVLWICRDRGEDIFLYHGENGLPIYWIDFLSQTAWVDFGSYIQIQLYVPCDQVACQ